MKNAQVESSLHNESSLYRQVQFENKDRAALFFKTVHKPYYDNLVHDIVILLMLFKIKLPFI